MDDIWKHFLLHFPNVLHLLPQHQKVVNILNTKSEELPNILLYSHNGFPLEIIYDAAFKQTYGDYKKTKIIWDKEVIYYETPYYFEIDLALPQQPKDLVQLTELIKHIANNPCIHAKRHIFAMRNIDLIVTNNKFYDFRVLLERYSKNILFICTTYNISKLEMPIRSRFQAIRLPLLQVSELIMIFGRMELSFHEYLEKYDCRDVYFALYVHYLSKYMPDIITEEFCSYKNPIIYNFLAKNKTPLSLEDIREITHKISIDDASIIDITMDLAKIIKPTDIPLLIKYAASIDHALSTTEGYRKPLYVEKLFNVAIYQLGLKKK